MQVDLIVEVDIVYAATLFKSETPVYVCHVAHLHIAVFDV